MFYLLISHNKKIVKIHGTPLLRINISRQPMVLQTKMVHYIEAKMLLNNPVCRNMVYDDGKGVYFTAKDRYGLSVPRIPPIRR